jgi:hypothetical protein
MPKTRFHRGRLALLSCIIVAGAAACQPSDGQQTAYWTPPALTDEDWREPDGGEVIQQMVDFMAAQQEVVVEALVSYEALQETGQNLHFDMLQRMAISKPDKFFWVTLNDDGSADSAWVSDGRFTFLKQPANIWGQISGPSDFREMVDRLVTEYDLDVPFEAILMRDPNGPLFGDDVTSLWWVGEAWVEGFWTNHVAAQKPGIDLEVWVRKGDEPFPAKLAITYTDEEGRPTYLARFRKWSTTVPDAVREFTFTPPPDAERVELVPVSGR